MLSSMKLFAARGCFTYLTYLGGASYSLSFTIDSFAYNFRLVGEVGSFKSFIELDEGFQDIVPAESTLLMSNCESSSISLLSSCFVT
jgi:hypothetical protein